MNAYKVMPRGADSYIVTAPSIAHVWAFTRHWRHVVIRRMVISQRGPFLAWVTAGWEPKATDWPVF